MDKFDLPGTRKEFEAELDVPPPVVPQLQSLLEWIRNLFALIMLYAHELGKSVKSDLHDIRYFLETIEPRVEALEQRPQPQTAVIPPLQPTLPTRRSKCKRCHAFGHDEENCRTKDPTVMKKRVAKNAKLKKQAIMSVAPPLAPALYPYTASPYPPPSAPPADRSYFAYVADATEMRRRTAQSTRDKRKARCQAAAT
jgi:hypothetical protein